MKKLFASLFGKGSRREQKPGARLELLALEERCNPSSFVSNGNLYIHGTNAADTVTVTVEGYSGVAYYRVNENGYSTWHRASSVWGGWVNFYGYGGDDTLNASSIGLGVAAYGMGGRDTLYGGWNHDYLDGGSDTDWLYGFSGNDVLVAGDDYSYNYLDGGFDNDVLYGGLGGDTLLGNWGNDDLYGGAGADRLYGSFGNDYLNGGDDGVADYLEGDVGADRFEIDYYWNGWYWANRDTPFDYDPYGQLDSMVNYY